MIASKRTRKILCHIHLIILSLSDFAQERIVAFINGHNDFLKKAPITPEKQVMIDDLEAVLDSYDLGVTVKHSDKGKRATFVTKIKEYQPSIVNQINGIITQINNITHTDKSKLKEFNLTRISIYYEGKESEILRYYKELLYNIKLSPEFLTVVPAVQTLVDKVNALYKVKKEKKDDIKIDITNMNTYVDPLAKVLLKNFDSLQTTNIDNLDAVIDYFPFRDMDLPVKNKEHLAPNQFNGIGMQGAIVNLIDVKQDFGNWVEADCRTCPVDIYLWLASEISSVIPKNAQKVCKGDRLIFKNSTIGSSTQMYLMVAFAEDVTVTEECKFKITIDKKKPQRKNIISPKVAVTVPIVAVPITEPVVVTPEPIVEN